MSQVSFNIDDGNPKDAPFIVAKVLRGDYASSQSAELRNIAVVTASAQADVARLDALGIVSNGDTLPIFSRSCGVLKIHKACRVHNELLQQNHGRMLGQLAKTDMLLQRDGSGINARKLFVCVPSAEDAKTVLLNGFGYVYRCQSMKAPGCSSRIPELQCQLQVPCWIGKWNICGSKTAPSYLLPCYAGESV